MLSFNKLWFAKCILQDKAFALVLRVLTAVKSAEVEKAVKILDKNEQDVLMKYIYRGFAEPTDGSSAVLLTWHEKVSRIYYHFHLVTMWSQYSFEKLVWNWRSHTSFMRILLSSSFVYLLINFTNKLQQKNDFKRYETTYNMILLTKQNLFYWKQYKYCGPLYYAEGFLSSWWSTGLTIGANVIIYIIFFIFNSQK